MEGALPKGDTGLQLCQSFTPKQNRKCVQTRVPESMFKVAKTETEI